MLNRNPTLPLDEVPPERPDEPLTLRSISPHYAAMVDKERELFEREEQIEAQTRPLAQQANREQWFAFDEHKTPAALVPKPPTEHPPSVIKWLGKLTPQPPAPGKPVAPVWQNSRDRLAALSVELYEIRAARRVLAPELAQAHKLANRTFCQRLRPEYDSVVQGLCEKIIALGDAWLAHQAWITDIEKQNGTRISNENSPLNVLFPPDEDSLFWRLLSTLDWAGVGGHHVEIPEAWRRWRQKNGGPY